MKIERKEEILKKMITKIYFQITDLESMNFDSDVNMTREQYDLMSYENFQQNEYMMKDFERYGFNVKNNTYYNSYTQNDKRENHTNNEFLKYSECEALIKKMGANKVYTDATTTDFMELNENGRMSVMNVNVNPNSIEYEAESEVRLWMGESARINSDRMMDNKSKFSALPKRDIKVMCDDDTHFIMKNCKIIEDNSNKSFPINLIVVIEKIISA